jgi:hypothetical protein
MTLLFHVFKGRITSEHNWPPRSPDFRSLDYYLRGAIKSVDHIDNTKTVREPKEPISNDIRSVPPIAVSSVFANRIRAQTLIFEFVLMYWDFLNIPITYGRRRKNLSHPVTRCDRDMACTWRITNFEEKNE